MNEQTTTAEQYRTALDAIASMPTDGSVNIAEVAALCVAIASVTLSRAQVDAAVAA